MHDMSGPLRDPPRPLTLSTNASVACRMPRCGKPHFRTCGCPKTPFLKSSSLERPEIVLRWLQNAVAGSIYRLGNARRWNPTGGTPTDRAPCFVPWCKTAIDCTGGEGLIRYYLPIRCRTAKNLRSNTLPFWHSRPEPSPFQKWCVLGPRQPRFLKSHRWVNLPKFHRGVSVVCWGESGVVGRDRAAAQLRESGHLGCANRSRLSFRSTVDPPMHHIWLRDQTGAGSKIRIVRVRTPQKWGRRT